MDRELIERLAKEAGLADFGGWTESNIERFAALIAEECAKLFERIDGEPWSDAEWTPAEAIREKFSVDAPLSHGSEPDKRHCPRA